MADMFYTTKQMRGLRVIGGRSGSSHIGKVAYSVCFPDRPQVAGFIVKRPDAMMVIKREDRFLAFDSWRLAGGQVMASADKDAWDDAACARLGVNLNWCVIWDGMPVITESGRELGTISEVCFERATGAIASVVLSEGHASDAILGTTEIPRERLVGYREGYIVTDDEAAQLPSAGGLAVAAGRGVARASHTVSQVAEKVGAKGASTGAAVSGAAAKAASAAGSAIQSGAYSLGGIIGKAKRSMEGRSETPPSEKLADGEVRAYIHDAPDIAAGTSLSDEGGAPVATKTSEDGEPAVSEKMARGVGRQIGRTIGAFAAFKEEYRKNVDGQ